MPDTMRPATRPPRTATIALAVAVVLSLACVACADPSASVGPDTDIGDTGIRPAPDTTPYDDARVPDAHQPDTSDTPDATADTSQASDGLADEAERADTSDGASTAGDTGMADATDVGTDTASGTDVAADTTSDAGADTLPDPSQLPRGLRWVRENPMFVSGLTPTMGTPPAWWVDEYLDDFGATAAHLWQNGMPSTVTGWRASGRDVRWLSWTLPDGTSGENRQLLGGMGANPPGRIGYQISDEPRTQEEFDAIVDGVAAVRAVDPDALIAINYTFQAEGLLPGFLQAQCDTVDADIFSYDQYTRSQGAYEHLERYREWGLKCDKPYWRYVRGYADAGSGEWSSASDMRWDAYVGLLYGYTGHSWFIYQISTNHNLATAFFDVTGAFDAAKTTRWHEAAAINRKLRNLGRAVTWATSTDVRYLSDIELLQPDATEPWTPGAGGDPYLAAIDRPSLQDAAIGFFEDDRGEPFIMFQNVHHSGGSYQVSSTSPATYHLDFDFSGAPAALDRTRLMVLDGETGTERFEPLTSTGPDTARLSITLDAGDVVLFKYANGRSFLLGP